MDRDKIKEIEDTLNELRSYMDLLESIKAMLENNPGLEVDTREIKSNAEGFSGAVTDLIYDMQQQNGYRVKISVTS